MYLCQGREASMETHLILLFVPWFAWEAALGIASGETKSFRGCLN